MSLAVVEIFYSLQGEGRYIGTPSIFIRLGGCNLNCPALPCDTLRAVDAKKFSHSWQNFNSADELLADALSAIPHGIKKHPKHVVITGGEPVLHFKNPIFIDLTSKLIARGYKITVETNATIEIDFARHNTYRGLTYSMSIKLSNSGEPYEKRVKPDIFKNYIQNSNDSFFKFVLDESTINTTAFDEITNIMNLAMSNLDIYCMPKGTNSIELQQNTRAVFDFCSKHGFCYSDRIHIRAHDNKDSV